LHFEPETANIEAVYLEVEEWVKIWTDIYKRYGPCHILVTGGEPFTYPNFMDLVSSLSEMHTFGFSTNLSWDINEFIKKVNRLKVEIEASFHPEFIGAEEFLKKIKLLKKKDYLVSATVVAYPLLLDKIIKYKEIFKKEGVRLNLYPYRGPHDSRNYPDAYSESERQLLKKLGLEIGIKASRGLMDVYKLTQDGNAQEKKQEGKICRMGQRYAKIIPNGEVYRCCAAVNKKWGDLGNVIKKTFELLDRPGLCPDPMNCTCYKSMVMGEEDRWLGYWKIPNDFRAEKKMRDELGVAKKLRDTGKIEEAVDKINQILKTRPGNVRALTLLGEVYLQKKDFVTAGNTLQEALKNNSNPDDASWIYRTLGRFYFESAMNNNDTKKEGFGQSLDCLEKAIRFADKSNNVADKAWAHYEIATVYHNKKNYPKAQENLKMALEYEPENGHFRELRTLLEKDAR